MILYNSTPPPHRNQTGLSLVELMIAMMLGLILVGGVIKVYLSSKQSNRLVNGISQVQERGRIATYFINNSARMTGYLGCNSTLSHEWVVNLLNGNPYFYKFGVPIGGFDNITAVPAAFANVAHKPITPADKKQKSDILTLRTTLGNNRTTTADSAASPLPITNTKGLAKNDIAVISDCASATIFQITAVNKADSTIKHAAGGGGIFPGNKQATIPNVFPAGSDLSRLATVSYFVAPKDTAHTDCSHHDCALWEKASGEAEKLLVPGVENLQVRYGVDTDGDLAPNQYKDIGDVANIDNVVSIKIGLLVASDKTALDAMPNAAVDFKLLGRFVAAPTVDMRFRRVFTSTISLRNRTL